MQKDKNNKGIDDLNKNKELNNKKDPINKENILEKELQEKKEKIKLLESEIFNINNKYKNDLINKSKEAQLIINQKNEEYKKKMDEEISNIKKFAIKNNAIDLINIINQFSNVINSPNNNEAVKNYVAGFKMFLGMFEQLLNSMNIYEIKINENDNFDEKIMEAIDIQIDSSKKENTIYKILKNGYKIHDQVLIYAQVIVYKSK